MVQGVSIHPLCRKPDCDGPLPGLRQPAGAKQPVIPVGFDRDGGVITDALRWLQVIRRIET
jgi:hypothetical protein